ncbi:MAG: GUN4 domain-containing protein [Stigonema ocellatum SAG 48.90 = DSM 106950]|nr:GUN4 domain-containing protein [Stigonema ocellatum SAG 48.90 = DSM 106950]
MSYCLNPNCSRPGSNSVTVKFCTSCGSKLLLAERYRATKQIGQGGFGKTFLAIDEYKLNQRCVIKQFLPQAQGTNNIEKASELFKLEAVQLAELGHTHPQIPELLAYFTQDNQQYLVQEFIDGQNLADELNNNGVFNEDQIIALLKSLLPVLQFVHDKQVIHRDIKPENIIRRSNGELVLVDFGAAKTVKPTALSVTGTVIGTAGYTSPEQAIGKATFASDIYSLGVTCLNLLTQVQPLELFDVTEWSWIWRNYLTVQESDNLAFILDKMVEYAVKRRYQSAIEVLQALNPPNKEPRLQRQREQLEYENNLRRYEQELSVALKAGYPLDEFVRNALKKIQQSLGISDEDVVPIEQQLLAPKQAEYERQQEAIKREQERVILENQRQLAELKEQEQRKSSPPISNSDDNLSRDRSIDYTRLRDLLKAGNWKDADYETYLVMLKFVGRKEGDWIRNEELLNFPCTTLRTIDSLWVKYSNGRFGFSVQKKIYLEVGGKPDGEYYEKAWKKFGDLVGWRVNQSWIYCSVTFYRHKVEGHLPARCFFGYRLSFGDGGCVWMSSLASRLVKCNL